MELKDFRPAPLDIDEAGEKLRPHVNTISGRGNGPVGKIIRVEREMDGGALAMINTSRWEGKSLVLKKIANLGG